MNKLAPLINAVGTIANNTFTNHPKYVLLLDNTDDFVRSVYYRPMKVNYSVISNRFQHNHGYYVANVRLTQVYVDSFFYFAFCMVFFFAGF